jgi:hypothetical protein
VFYTILQAFNFLPHQSGGLRICKKFARKKLEEKEREREREREREARPKDIRDT